MFIVYLNMFLVIANSFITGVNFTYGNKLAAAFGIIGIACSLKVLLNHVI